MDFENAKTLLQSNIPKGDVALYERVRAQAARAGLELSRVQRELEAHQWEHRDENERPG